MNLLFFVGTDSMSCAFLWKSRAHLKITAHLLAESIIRPDLHVHMQHSGRQPS